MLQDFIKEGFRSAKFRQGNVVVPENAYSQDALASTLTWAAFIILLGSALANGIKIDIAQSLCVDAASFHVGTQDMRHRLKASTRELCWLCARAANLRHTSQYNPGTPFLRGASLLDAWRELWEALQWWSEQRPFEIYPVLESFLDQRDSFSTIVFTTPCASFCTQLFHTALLLLLQCKPRTLRIAEYFPGAVSQIWNARRVCTIAICNDTREKWHPTLWSSFLQAARYITDRKEQQLILRHARKVLSLTRWNLQFDLDVLQGHWNWSKG